MPSLNRFDLMTLRLFIAVVDAGSLTAGADRFHCRPLENLLQSFLRL